MSLIRIYIKRNIFNENNKFTNITEYISNKVYLHISNNIRIGRYDDCNLMNKIHNTVKLNSVN